MNQMMAAAAGAKSAVLGQEIEISPPETRVVGNAAEALENVAHVEHMVSASFSVHGESCRLVQLVPNAFTVRMTRALDELNAEYAGPPEDADGAGSESSSLDYSLLHVGVRVWAELGRARMAIGQAVGLSSGAVVELDRAVEEPIDVYVNGRLFALGRLVVADNSEWAVRLDEVLGATAPAGHPELKGVEP
jgi:flagellar motor switch protein FliN/FliY